MILDCNTARSINLTVLTLALTCITILSGCAGRDARPIPATSVTDSSLNCNAIAREFEANERQIQGTTMERSQAQTKNAVVGTAGVVLFPPALLFLDPKSPEKIEINALRNRNQVLTQIAQTKRCPAGTTYNRGL